MKTKIHKHLYKECSDTLCYFLNGELEKTYSAVQDIKDNIDLYNSKEVIEYKKRGPHKRTS